MMIVVTVVCLLTLVVLVAGSVRPAPKSYNASEEERQFVRETFKDYFMKSNPGATVPEFTLSRPTIDYFHRPPTQPVIRFDIYHSDDEYDQCAVTFTKDLDDNNKDNVTVGCRSDYDD